MKKVLAMVLAFLMVLTVIPIVTSAEAVELTHTQFVNAADRFRQFVDRNDNVPSYVTADSVRLSTADFLYAAADAIVDLATGNRISAIYKAVEAVPEKNVREDIVKGELSYGEYVALAKQIITDIDISGSSPAYIGTSLGAISPRNLSYVFAQAISYYRYHKYLPAAIMVDEWLGRDYSAPTERIEPITPEETILHISYFMDAALRVKKYIETNSALPASTEVDGRLLTMAQFLTTAVDVYLSGEINGEIALAYANVPTYPVENLNTVTLDKAGVDALITAIDAATTSQAPASVTYDGNVYGFNTLVYTVACALSEISTNGSIETIEVKSWESISGIALPLPGTEPTPTPVDPNAPRKYDMHSVAVMSRWAENFLTTYGADMDEYSTFVSLELTKVSSADAFLTMANAVDELGKEDGNHENAVIYSGVKAADFASKEDFETGTVTKAEYLSIAEQILEYAQANNSYVIDTTYCELGGLGYETTMLLLADIIQYYDAKKVLPESVEITRTWAEISGVELPTPNPTATPTAKPTLEPTPQAEFTVTFVDYDEETVLKTETVKAGEAATAPAAPTREGYKFTGWNQPFENVISDMLVVAQYQKIVAPTVMIGNVVAKAGETVSVNVSIVNNPGLFGAILTYKFDSGLTLTGAKAGSAFDALDVSFPKYASPFTVFCDGMDAPATEDGIIMTFTFTVPADAQVGQVYNITASYLDGDVVDGDFEDVDLDIIAGTITVG